MTAVEQTPSSADARLAEQMELIITARLAKNQLVVPPMSQVAVKCLALIRKPDMSLREVAALIECDPVMTAQLMRAANSAALATREPARSVLQSVTRMGAQHVTTFLVEVSARKVFESRDQRIAEACRAVWEHSVAVAILTREVVTLAQGSDPELGYLAGLLHDVGKPIVAAMLLEAEKSVTGNKPSARWIQSSTWIQVIQRVHRRVGVELAEKWQLPDPLRDAIRDCAEYDSANRESIANAVRFANALAKRAGIYAGDVASDDVEALIMIGRSLLRIEDGVPEKLIHGLRERVQQQIG